MQEDKIDIEIKIERPTLTDRIQRDQAARLRRKEVKEAKALHSFKEEKEARERIRAKRMIEKQKRKKLQKQG
jgi:nitrate/TMAO reductase-like tetraheme cytochrome c subunit